jgi:hypothetical protein
MAAELVVLSCSLAGLPGVDRARNCSKRLQELDEITLCLSRETEPEGPIVVVDDLMQGAKSPVVVETALGVRPKTLTGCRMTALDETITGENGGTGGRGPTQADILIDLAAAAELFHSADGTAFADVDINGHRETSPVRTKGFPALAGPAVLRGDRRRTELRGPAIRLERN